MNPRLATGWHALTAAVAIAALVLQTALVLSGEGALTETAPTDPWTNLGRLVSYFTIQSNLLVAVGVVVLARDPLRDGPGFRVVRAASLAGITVTGLVHFVLLRPLLDLEGLSLVCDRLLHLVVPVLAVLGWAAFGPRPRVDRRSVGRALLWPVVWLGYALVVGLVSGWWVYPFLDVESEGWGSVLLVCLGITALFLAVFAVIATLDRRLPAAPRVTAAPG